MPTTRFFRGRVASPAQIFGDAWPAPRDFFGERVTSLVGLIRGRLACPARLLRGRAATRRFPHYSETTCAFIPPLRERLRKRLLTGRSRPTWVRFGLGSKTVPPSGLQGRPDQNRARDERYEVAHSGTSKGRERPWHLQVHIRVQTRNSAVTPRRVGIEPPGSANDPGTERRVLSWI